MSEAAPAPAKRRPSTGRDVAWDWIQALATGCAEDYVVPGAAGSPRLPSLDARLSTPPPKPVAALQEGVPVYYLNPASRTFESRVLKVDQALSFLLLLPDSPALARKQDILAARLLEVGGVLGGLEALQACTAYLITDPSLTGATATVVQLGNHGEVDVPPLEQVLILLTPPHQHLRRCIRACRAAAQAKHFEDRAALSLAAKPQQDECDSKGTLHKVRVADVAAIFKESESLDLELVFRRSHDYATTGSMRKPVVHKIALPLELTSYRREVLAITRRISKLSVLDATRVGLVIYELATLRQWAAGFDGVFEGGLYTYLQWEDGHLLPLLGHDTKVAARMFRPPQLRRPTPFENCGRAALRAAVASLRQMVNIEVLASRDSQTWSTWISAVMPRSTSEQVPTASPSVPDQAAPPDMPPDDGRLAALPEAETEDVEELAEQAKTTDSRPSEAFSADPKPRASMALEDEWPDAEVAGESMLLSEASLPLAKVCQWEATEKLLLDPTSVKLDHPARTDNSAEPLPPAPDWAKLRPAESPHAGGSPTVPEFAAPRVVPEVRPQVRTCALPAIRLLGLPDQVECIGFRR